MQKLSRNNKSKKLQPKLNLKEQEEFMNVSLLSQKNLHSRKSC